MIEIWKRVKNHEDYYEISSLGRVRNVITGKEIVGDTNSVGYRRVTLYMPFKQRYFVHRLVAEHFCNGYAKDLVVNHIDGNKTNNTSDNLEFITRSENDLHAYRLGLRHVNYTPDYTNEYVLYDRTTNKVLKHYKNTMEAAKDLNTEPGRIYNRSTYDQTFGNNLGIIKYEPKTIQELIDLGVLPTMSEPVLPDFKHNDKS